MSDKMSSKIRVAWVCMLSNQELRDRLPTRMSPIEKLIRRIMHSQISESNKDYAQWNSNAIAEFEKIDDIEVHIIAPWMYLTKNSMHLEIRGVNYYIFRDESSSLIEFFKRRIKGYYCDYKKNANTINRIIDHIHPDIVHLMGAENPNYSKAVLALNKKYPLIVQLQTLMSIPGFQDNYPIDANIYEIRSEIEKRVILRADYLATPDKTYINYIITNIKPSAKIVDKMILAVAEDRPPFAVPKKYDWVYFANGIEKAFDLVVEAFGVLHRDYSSTTLNVVGSYSQDFRTKMEHRLEELNCLRSVNFCGSLPTHDDVLKEICRSKYAILPLKVDLISGTIRESMAMGLPVVTTITPGTIKLNEVNQTVLLSETGDHKALANNMGRLINDPNLANTMRENGFIYMAETIPSNADRISKWIETYRVITNV